MWFSQKGTWKHGNNDRKHAVFSERDRIYEYGTWASEAGGRGPWPWPWLPLPPASEGTWPWLPCPPLPYENPGRAFPPPRIFIHGTDFVDRRLIVLFFALFAIFRSFFRCPPAPPSHLEKA